MVKAVFLVSAQVALGFRTQVQVSDLSFPEETWENFKEEPTCEALAHDAQQRMATYTGRCGVGQSDIDSGATSFALLRSGAEKLCACDEVDVEEVTTQLEQIDELGCTGPLFGPIKVLDTTLKECKDGVLNLDDYQVGDAKLAEGLLQTDSFPEETWENFKEEASCEALTHDVQQRMATYTGACGVGQSDMDSGATSFALLRSGAEKLCACDEVHVDEVTTQLEQIDELGCTGPLFGPIKVLDTTLKECKDGVLNLDDYQVGDAKLAEGLLQTDSFPAES